MRFFLTAVVLALAFLSLSLPLISALADPVIVALTVMPPPPSGPGDVLVPPQPQVKSRGYVLEKINLDAVIEGQKADCTLKYVIYNPGKTPLEVDFLVPLPEGGQVTGLTLLNGKTELVGEIYDKEQALAIYQKIVSQMRDPALLEYAGRSTYRARVFPVPPGQRQTLELHFDYLAPKSEGRVSLAFPLAGPLTQGFAPELDIHVVIKESEGLSASAVYSPLAGVDIKHQKGQEAVVSFKDEDQPVPNFFRLHYNLESGPLGALVLSHKPEEKEDGFFLFLADPVLDLQAEKKVSKNVVFVLDKSGSMNGPKFEQAKGALRFILERLGQEDSFNLVDYNERVVAWKPELMAMSPENRDSALNYVDNLRSGGTTNIEEALKTAFNLVDDPSLPNYIIFLTDGQPTAGVTGEVQLAQVAREANTTKEARLFAFGLGFNVNSRLLDRLSGQAGGTSVFVDPDENLETQVSTFFSRLTTPALTRPVLSAKTNLNRVIPEILPDLFTGQQQVVVGRYPKGGATTFTLAGGRGGKKESFEYPVTLSSKATADGEFIAGVWAQRRIGEIIDALDLAQGEPNPELVAELVSLSKKYGILTPYTSFLALEDQDITRPAALAPLAQANMRVLGETVGRQANYQRSVKAKMRMADSAPPAPSGAIARQEAQMMASMDQTVVQAQEAGRGGSLNLPQQWGGRTFFFKSGQWQGENLTEKDLKNPKTIVQLSEEYFELASRLEARELVWLTRSEPILFQHEGLNYLIEPVKP